MSTGDRTPLLIAIGVIAAVLIVVLAIVIRQSGNDENGYPEEVRNQFLDACNAQSGATPDRCQCILDEIEANVDLDEFVAKEPFAKLFLARAAFRAYGQDAVLTVELDESTTQLIVAAMSSE